MSHTFRDARDKDLHDKSVRMGTSAVIDIVRQSQSQGTCASCLLSEIAHEAATAFAELNGLQAAQQLSVNMSEWLTDVYADLEKNPDEPAGLFAEPVQ